MGDLVVPGPQPGRVLLGRLAPASTEARLWGLFDSERASPALAAPPGYGVLVVGVTRSGKTTSLLAPNVVRWDGPVITTSIRSDVLQHAWEEREAAGWPVLIYNPSNQGEYGSNTWSPLAVVMGERPWGSARRVAKALVEAAGLAEDGRNSRSNFWNATAADYIGPLLLAAAQEGPSMEPVMRWLQEGEDAKKEIRQRLKDHAEALRVAEGVWKMDSEVADSVFLTARTTLSAYNDEEVLETCRAPGPGKLPDITPDTVLGTEGPDGSPGASLFIVSPPDDWRYFAPLFSALVTSLVTAAFRRGGAKGPLDPPLLLALDEVANIAPLKDLPSWASQAAGAGVQIITVLQDLGQAERIWSKAETRELLSNHPAKLLLGGTTDLETLKWAREMLGEVDTRRWVQARGRGGRSASEQWERRPPMSLDEIRRIPQGAGLLISRSAPAAIVRLRQGTTI